MTKVRNIFSLLLVFICIGSTMASIETVNSRIGKDQIKVNASISVQDSRYPNVEQSNTAKVVKASSKIIFSIDATSPLYYATNSTVKIGLQITSWDKLGQATVLSSIVDLTVTTSTNSAYLDKSVYVIDGSHKITAVIQYIKDDNDNVIPLASIPLNLSLEVEQTTERYYQFSTTLSPTLFIYTADSTTLNEWDIRWNVISGAEAYELEWTYLNDYNLTSLADINISFKNNATRVRVSNNNYRLSLVFDKGYVVFRVRAIGRAYSDYTKELYSAWSTTGDPTKQYDNITLYVKNGVNQYARIFTDSRHEYKKNWQYSSSFAEEGKKKEVVSYFDGSLRNRQSVTKSSTTQKSIVGETIYDAQGRPAIQALPVPTDEKIIKYYPDFNRKATVNTDVIPYTRADFDLDTDNATCTSTLNPMDKKAKGAAFYYSENNLDQAGFQSYTPDAKQFPFSQIEYTPDNTGRIRRQGGVGKEFQLGSSHETKYFYGQPEQIQLDRLFGSEVGDYRHYKKNMVVDANGQVSVSYMDQAGRTIATSLAGNSPTNLTPLAGPSPAVQMSIDYIKSADPLVPNSNKFINNALVFSKELLVATAGTYQFSYDLQAPKYQDATCMTAPLCFDCMYDLEISVRDACGTPMFAPIKQTVGTLDTICGAALTFALSPNPINVSLPLGSYTVSKTLTISEKAIDYYTTKYLKYAKATCVTPYSVFETQAMSKIDTMACIIDCAACVASLGAYATHSDISKGNPALTTYDPLYRYMTQAQYDEAIKNCNAPCEPTNLCETQYQTLLSDVSPGGQYAKFDVSVDGLFSTPDPLSLLNESNVLSTPTSKTWRLPKRITFDYNNFVNGLPTEISADGYFDADGTRTKISVVQVSAGVYKPAIIGTSVETDANGNLYTWPEKLANPLDFINLFSSHKEWAISLVTYHPEYTYYKWCIRNSQTSFSAASAAPKTSDDFDSRLRLVTSYSVAAASLLTDGNALNPTDILSKDPYFANTSSVSPRNGQGEPLRPTMAALLTNYGSATNPSLKALAGKTIRCGTTYYGTPNPACPAYGSGTPADSLIRNQEWVLYRNLYLAEKQKLQQRAAEIYATTQNRCNSCIGIKDGAFNPWSGGLSPGFFDANTPCGAVTFPLYKDKVKRFQNSTDAFIQSGLDPNATTQEALDALVKSADYKMYQETGQCGMTTDLGFLLDAMASKGKLLTLATPLSTEPAFTYRLYKEILAPTPTPTQFQDYLWKGTVTGNNLLIQFAANGNIDASQLTLTLPAGSWTNVKRFTNIKFINESPVGTYTFQLTAYVYDQTNQAIPPTQVTVTGSTNIKLNGCSFSDICGPSETAFQLQNLISALATDLKLTTANVNIKDPRFSKLFYDKVILPVTGTASGIWNGNTSGTGCSLVLNGVTCNLNISLATGLLADVRYLTNLRLNPANPNQSFTADAWFGNGQSQKLTVTMTTGCFNLQKCSPPPNKCAGPEYRNNDIFYTSLNSIASQKKLLTKFSLINLPEFAKLFSFVDLTKSFWVIGNYNPAAKSLLVNLKEAGNGTDSTKRGTLTLKFSNIGNTRTFADIVSISNLQVSTYSFTVLAKFSDNTSELLVGTLPELKLKACETCTDYVYAQTVTIDGDCECGSLPYPNSSVGEELEDASCAEGFKMSANNTCTSWPIGSNHSGRFLAVHWNGADATVWKQNLNASSFLPNKMYTFKVWYKRMTGTFDLTLKITNLGATPLVPTVLTTVHVTPSNHPTDTWFEVSGVWTSPTNFQDISIEVVYHRVDLNTNTYFGLDELSLMRMSPCNDTFKDPYIIKYVNPCIKNLQDIAKANALESYKAYIKGITSTFRENYINTCKNALENLNMKYTDREHHQTLYYYDQAGNLIKTVPPEGVALVTLPADFTQIAQDRLNKKQTFFTKHTLKTRYEYNALNQLIKQATPDQDLTNKWLLNGANLIPAGTKIYGMAFSDGNNGYVVGDNGSGDGVIYSTTDGGKTWNQASRVGVGNLQDVQSVNAGALCYAISEKGELVKKVLTEEKWSIINTPSSQKLNDLYFSSATAGIIVGNGGTILKTSNSGTSWDPVTIDPAALFGNAAATVNFNDCHFINATTGYIAGSKGVVLRTTNAGANWSALPGVTNPINGTVTLNAIHFLSATSGYVAGVNTTTGIGVIGLATINAGQTSTSWSYPAIQDIIFTNCEFKTIYAVNATNVFAGGTDGAMYAVSANTGGAFYRSSITGISNRQEITELTFPDAANPYVGYGSLKSGQLIKSTVSPGTITWAASNVNVTLGGSITNPPANGIYFEPVVPGVSATGYLATDGGSVLKTTDGGTTWSSLTNYGVPVLEDVFMVKNTTTGYAVGSGGSIIKTINSGAAWTNVPNSQTSIDLKAVAFENVNTGIAVGNAGRIVRVINGASPYNVPSQGITNDLFDVVQLTSPASTYLAVGGAGTIVKGTSAGSAWTAIATTGTTQNLYAVCFVGNIGYAVGAAGVCVKTIDGGTTWVNRPTGVTAILREVYFKDELIGYALGDAGMIIKTIDGGVNWKVQPGTGTGNFYAANFTPDGNAIIGGTTTAGNSNMANLSDESFDYSSRFWYDRLGRMVISQNSKQFNKPIKAYSYTKYDAQGRIVEVGEVANTSDIATLTNAHGVVYDDAAFKTWVTQGVRLEVTTTKYDAPVTASLAGFTQENLRKRVAATYIDEDGDLSNGYTQASLYSYDIHGNVKTLVQDISALGEFDQRYKRIDYIYDLISGAVNKVCYQKGQSDQFYHKYEYDADNRITRVFTSNNDVIWDQDAKYFYYNHGPLARVELGDNKVQANDYVYTLQGWLKGVNSNTLNTGRDPGKDGTTGTAYKDYPAGIHAKVAQDAYGYSLAYFDAATGINNDYSAINTANNAVLNDFQASVTGNSEFTTVTPNLFNGNIKRMVTSFKDIQLGSATFGQAIPQLTDYKYDQLNRITQMKAFRDFVSSANSINPTYDKSYESSMTYDANGNILTMNANGRYNGTPASLDMDKMRYQYDWIVSNDPTKGKRSNRLYHVNDDAPDINYATDINNQGPFTPAAANNLSNINAVNNYGYDELGNLIRDNKEGISNIQWNVYGKIKRIERTQGSTGAIMDFTYDAAGNRLSKTDESQTLTTSYYVRDASGNVMAVYNQRCGFAGCDLTLTEHSLYGSSRLGVSISSGSTQGVDNIFSRNRGEKSYELSNHLGNVITTVSDRVIPHTTNGTAIDYYVADVKSTSDYYPFGMQMPGRNYTSASGYRYGFNGKENDNEVKGNGNSVDFGARIYDPRLGRFLSLDPRIRDFPDLSPFAFAANIPIRYVDVDGEGPGDRVKAALSFFGKGIIYSQDAKLNSGELRTGSSAQALKYLDCSEFVCRVLKADGITAKVEAKTSGELSKYLSNTDKFTHSDKAQVGDIAVWGEWTVDKDKDGNAIIDPRTNKPKESWSGGHVGIVSEVDAKGNVKLVHAAGNGKGVKSNPYAIPAKDYRPDKTFAGFYRPNVETADGKQIDEVPKVEATPVETKTP